MFRQNYALDSEVTSVEIAEFLDSKHVGDEVVIEGVNSLDTATSSELTFCVYDDEGLLQQTDAGCIICKPSMSPVSGKSLVYSTDSRLDFVKVVNKYFLTHPEKTFIHPSAVIAEESEIGEQCAIGPNVYIGPDVVIGDRCRIQAGTSIGGEGFGFFADESGQLLKQIHQGSVVIGDQVEIGSNCSIDRAVFDETVIRKGTKMDNLIHIAHNVQIGENVWIADAVSVSGSVTIGNRVRIHPNATIADHTTVGEQAEIAMNAGVLEDVDTKATVVGTPAEPLD